jgi:hypothetical protein
MCFFSIYNILTRCVVLNLPEKCRDQPVVVTVADPGVRPQVDDLDLAPEAEVRPEVLRQVEQRVVSDVKTLQLELLRRHFVESFRVEELVLGVVVLLSIVLKKLSVGRLSVFYQVQNFCRHKHYNLFCQNTSCKENYFLWH